MQFYLLVRVKHEILFNLFKCDMWLVRYSYLSQFLTEEWQKFNLLRESKNQVQPTFEAS